MKQNVKRISAAAVTYALLVLLQGAFSSGQAQTVAPDPCPANPTGNCIDDVVPRNQCPNNCTANDVSIALLLNQKNIECELGKDFDVNLVAQIVATSAERWDIGMFIALDGGTARTGMCYRDYLHPAATSYTPGTITTHVDPATGMLVLDSFLPNNFFNDGESSNKTPDKCGDLEQGIINVYEIPQTITIPCVDRNNNGIADISSCVSWDNTKNNTCTDVDGTIPNTKAKCRCETMDIANVPIKASLTLVKKVINDNGGTAKASDWTLTAAGDGGFSGAGVCDDSGACLSATNGPTTIKPKTAYKLSESGGPAGYTAGTWSCDGGTFDAATATITLTQSGNVTCMIANDDIAPTLTLKKKVVNDNGGTAKPGDWQLTAAGDGGFTDNGDSVASHIVKAGVAYVLSESAGPAGYTAGSWSCTGGTLSGSTVTIANGESAVCEITNDDQQAYVIVNKVVVNDNGGSAAPDDFKLTLDGAGTKSGVKVPVKPGVHTAAETLLSGYSFTGFSGDCGTDGAVTVALGETKTCTLTNDDQPGAIIVKKTIKGTATATGFQFETTGTGYDGFTLQGGDQNSQTLSAGSYSVKEMVGQLNWVLTGIGGSTDVNTPYNCVVSNDPAKGFSGSKLSTGVGDLNTQTAMINLKNGDIVTCTFENTGNGATRTQGFWQTHPQLAEIAWNGGSRFGHTFPGVAAVPSIGDQLIKGKVVTSTMAAGKNQLMGGFWSNIAKTSKGAKRSSLDQARMQLLQQLLAAELNASAFGSLPSGGAAKFVEWEKALAGTDQKKINTAQQQAAAFNSQGDNSTFTPGTSADSKTARAYADIPFWNTF